jgi:hypothetical protein
MDSQTRSGLHSCHMPLGITVFLVCVSAAHALAMAVGPVPAPTRESTDATCRAAETLDDAHKLRPRIVADLSNEFFPKPGDGGGTWRSFETPAALQAFVKKEGSPRTRAQLWSAADATTLVTFQFQGVWHRAEAEYCFRSDGSLARADATFFRAGGMPERRVAYFTPERTGDRLSVGGLDDEQAETIPIYPTVASLPFLAPPPISSRGRASLLPPSAHERDLAAMTAFVRAHLGGVKRCYERRLAKRPALAGKLIGRWTVDTAGKSHDFAWQLDELGDPEVARCIRGVIAAWLFDPSPSVPTGVTFPFVFQAADRALRQRDWWSPSNTFSGPRRGAEPPSEPVGRP